MAQETLISPGVLTRENDLSQITQLPASVGLALVGPTVKGKPYIPTVVTSYSDYKNRFGGSFVSGGANYEFLTSITAYNYFQQGGTSILVTRVTSGSYTPASASVVCSGSAYALASSMSIVLETINVGTMANNTGSILSNGALSNGNLDNIRWEVSNVNPAQGTFTLLVRRGDDNTNSKSVLETFSNLSLDPLQPNYVAAVIGDQSKTVAYDSDMGGYYIQVSGSYPNNSRYVRVKSVKDTPNYFNNVGGVGTESDGTSYSASLPQAGSGSYGGSFANATGNDIPYIGASLFQNNSSTLPQGIPVGNYATASNILSNKDEYDYELITTPGLQHADHATAQNNFISNAEARGDHFYIMDLTPYNASIGTPVTEAQEMDTNYAGAYWPWVQVSSPETGRNVWVPASTIMPSVYAFNDNVSAEWFAPAGLNRGGLGGVIQAERKLSPINRDNLYAGKVNPIATFPNVGVTAFGQKTLQQKASALDRINVRRLLIALKRYIGNVSKTLIFEQNTTVTRNRFLSQVTPYLESVQQRQGLYAFKVVMDETNNTADVIDRNQLVGQIYLQPTRTAEFILLDFNILPTGVEFGA